MLRTPRCKLFYVKKTKQFFTNKCLKQKSNFLRPNASFLPKPFSDIKLIWNEELCDVEISDKLKICNVSPKFIIFGRKWFKINTITRWISRKICNCSVDIFSLTIPITILSCLEQSYSQDREQYITSINKITHHNYSEQYDILIKQ